MLFFLFASLFFLKCLHKVRKCLIEEVVFKNLHNFSLCVLNSLDYLLCVTLTTDIVGLKDHNSYLTTGIQGLQMAEKNFTANCYWLKICHRYVCIYFAFAYAPPPTKS